VVDILAVIPLRYIQEDRPLPFLFRFFLPAIASPNLFAAVVFVEHREDYGLASTELGPLLVQAACDKSEALCHCVYDSERAMHLRPPMKQKLTPIVSTLWPKLCLYQAEAESWGRCRLCSEFVESRTCLQSVGLEFAGAF